MIKLGEIQNTASTSGVAKKPYVAYEKKREEEANETVIVRGRPPTYHALYQQVTDVSLVPTQQLYTIPTNQRAVQQPASYQ